MTLHTSAVAVAVAVVVVRAEEAGRSMALPSVDDLDAVLRRARGRSRARQGRRRQDAPGRAGERPGGQRVRHRRRPALNAARPRPTRDRSRAGRGVRVDVQTDAQGSGFLPPDRAAPGDLCPAAAGTNHLGLVCRVKLLARARAPAWRGDLPRRARPRARHPDLRRDVVARGCCTRPHHAAQPGGSAPRTPSDRVRGATCRGGIGTSSTLDAGDGGMSVARTDDRRDEMRSRKRSTPRDCARRRRRAVPHRPPVRAARSCYPAGASALPHLLGPPSRTVASATFTGGEEPVKCRP
jgi:hypothetical protein